MLDWLTLNERALGWLGIVSAVIFIGTLAAVPFLIARMPADYFVRPRRHLSYRRRKEEKHWILLVLKKISKNLLGWMLIGAGLLMLVLPGQGLITILLGITLIDFPKKRALQCRIIRQRRVLRAINWIRARAHCPPLQAPAKA